MTIHELIEEFTIRLINNYTTSEIERIGNEINNLSHTNGTKLSLEQKKEIVKLLADNVERRISRKAKDNREQLHLLSTIYSLLEE